MKSLLSAVVLALIPSLAYADTLAYDNHYDARDGSLTTVACSNGPNGLITRGFTTFGSLPNFPNIGAAQAVTGFNSPACGTCWEVTYTNAAGVKKSLNITAIDVAGSGFNVAQAAMDTLTGGHAVEFGRVVVTSRQVDAAGCGFH
ncbi:cerato-platanin-related secreted protein [Marasmius fiardii PR-910]|nr:cerato-platanin-related secreted protein [Marasmius fiardii PR-910]